MIRHYVLALTLALTGATACSKSEFADRASARGEGADGNKKPSDAADGGSADEAAPSDDGAPGKTGGDALETENGSGTSAPKAMACSAFREELRARWLAFHLHDDLANGKDLNSTITALGERLQMMEPYGFGDADVQRLEATYAFLVDGQNAPDATAAAAERDAQAKLLEENVRLDGDCAYLETSSAGAAAPLALVEELAQVKKGERADFKVGKGLLDQAYQQAKQKAADQEKALVEANKQIEELQMAANQCRFADPSYRETMDCIDAGGNHGSWSFGNFAQDTTGPCGKRFIISPADWYFDGTNGTKACAAGDRCFYWDFYDVNMGWHSRHSVIIRNYDVKSCNVIFTREGTGCFAEDTRITLAGGKTKKAKDVAKGDKLYNPLTKKAVEVSRVIFGPEKKALYDVGFEGGTAVRVTEEHVFPTAKGLKQARELSKGDEIYDADGKARKVSKLATVVSSGRVVVWNFEVKGGDGKDEDHTVLADGVATGDLYLQEQLKLRGAKLVTRKK